MSSLIKESPIYKERLETRKAHAQAINARFNGERLDEKMAKDAVLQYCLLNNIKISEAKTQETIGSTSPDYVFYSEGEFVALLEVRQSGVGFTLDDAGKERVEQETIVMRNSEKLLLAISKWAAPSQTILLTIDHHSNLFSTKGIKQLSEILKSEFQNNLETEYKKLEVAGEIISARSTEYYKNLSEYSPLKFIYGPSLNSQNPARENSLDKQAKYILTLCIEEKEKKYQSVLLPKWLAILNCHPILNICDYREAYRELVIQGGLPAHSFNKIFIVSDGIAYLL